MNCLLDTHTIIWLLSEPEKLSVKVRKVIEYPGNSLFVSTISYWEISLKFSVNKLSISGLNPDAFPAECLKNGLNIIPLEYSDASDYYKLRYIGNHKDPFDRMLIWQAIKQNLVLISADRTFEQYQKVGLQTLW